MPLIDAAVLEQAIYYHDLLTTVRRYAPTYKELLKETPEQLPSVISLFISRARQDIDLVQRLNVPKIGSILPTVVRHYDELESHFAADEKSICGGGSSAVNMLDYLAYFVRDIQHLSGKVHWFPQAGYEDVQERFTKRLFPLFESHYIGIEDNFQKILESLRDLGKFVPPMESSSPQLSLLPLLDVDLSPHNSASAGTLYLLGYRNNPSQVSHRILFDGGQQNQIEFNDMASDEIPGTEPDKGYLIDTLTEGYLPSLKQTLKSALEKMI